MKNTFKVGDLVQIQGYGNTIFVVTNTYTNLGGWGPNSSQFCNIQDMNFIVYLPNNRKVREVRKVS